jgi:hypothetical protein
MAKRGTFLSFFIQKLGMKTHEWLSDHLGRHILDLGFDLIHEWRCIDDQSSIDRTLPVPVQVHVQHPIVKSGMYSITTLHN